MKSLFICVLALLAASLVAAHKRPIHHSWEFFLSHHKKVYTSEAEALTRRQIFENNMKIAVELERKNPQARFGASPYADMTAEEFKVRHNAEKHFEASRKASAKAPFAPLYSEEEIRAVPSSFDWRTKGVVTPVKDQGQCGSCWSFSTTGNIEGQWALYNKTLVSLSEQQLVSCDTIDQGCNGGLMNSAFDWLLQTKGGWINTEDSYPYASGSGSAPSCQSTGKVNGAKITGHVNIAHDENQMMVWMANNGPIAIAVDASSWQLYFGGVMTSCSASSLDHGVLLVAYVNNASTPYWIIKNSWNAGWGEQGYIYVGKGTDQCWITHYPVSSIVGKPPAPTPNPTPVQSGYFVHTVCDETTCKTGCESNVWKQGACVSYDGVSFTATCDGTTVAVTAYYQSLNCTGPSVAKKEPVNQCKEDDADFAYYTNSCPSSVEVMATSRRATKNLLKKMFKKQKN
eukprot:PhF_6_TR12950/c0_g1_i1/m.20438/K01373/CTSF; cathepsin F